MHKPGRRERQRRRCCTSDLNSQLPGHRPAPGDAGASSSIVEMTVRDGGKSVSAPQSRYRHQVREVGRREDGGREMTQGRPTRGVAAVR